MYKLILGVLLLMLGLNSRAQVVAGAGATGNYSTWQMMLGITN